MSAAYETAVLTIELSCSMVAGQGIEPCSTAYETVQFTRTVTRNIFNVVGDQGFEPS